MAEIAEIYGPDTVLTRLYREIHGALDNVAYEDLTIAAMIGVLEMVKADLMASME